MRWLRSNLQFQWYAVVGWFIWVCLLPGYAEAAFNPFVEVAPGHWTYVALDRFRTLGFVGDLSESGGLPHSRTRLEMALEVALVLDVLSEAADNDLPSLQPRLWHKEPRRLVVAYNEAVGPELALPDSDVRLLENLVTYFLSELEVLGYRFERQTTMGGLGLDALARALGQFQTVGQAATSRAMAQAVPGSSGRYILRNPMAGWAISQIDRQYRLGATVLWGDGTVRLDERPYPVVFTVQSQPTIDAAQTVESFADLGGGWSDVAKETSDNLLGLQAGVKIGQLGSTVLFARREQDNPAEFFAGLDSAVHLDRFTVGATLLHSMARVAPDSDEGAVEEGTLAAVQGSYVLTPGVVLSAGLASSIWGERDAALLRLGGSLQLGDGMSLEAVYRLQSAGFRRALSEGHDPELAVFSLAFDLGATRWTAGVDQARLPESGGDLTRTTTSVGVHYPVNELTVLRASRADSVHTGALGPDEFDRSALTAVGLDFYLPNMNLNVKLGYSLMEQWGMQNPSLAGRSSETEVGIEYELPSGSIALRYKVGDASADSGDAGDRPGANMGAEAAFTIRF